MKWNVLMTCFAIVAVVIVVSFFLTVPESWLGEEPVSQSSEDQPKDTVDYAYELKEHEGRLAVYFYGEEEPRTVFDVYLSTLPEYDQKQLSVGIPIKNYKELLQRIEDYSS